jgi:hypothetical protein
MATSTATATVKTDPQEGAMKLTPLEIAQLIFGFCITMLLVLVVFTGIANSW